MNDQVKIEKLTIKTGDKTIELTLEEAKSLQKALNDTLGDSRPAYWPVTVIQQPPYRQSGLWPYYPTITCGQFDQPSALSGSPVQSFGTLTQPSLSTTTSSPNGDYRGGGLVPNNMS